MATEQDPLTQGLDGGDLDAEVSNIFAFAVSGFLALISLPMVTSPKVMSLLLADQIREMNSTEVYLARCLAMAQLALALFLVIQTGIIPMSSANASASDHKNPISPFRKPTITISSVYLLALAAHSWTNNVKSIGVGAAFLALFGSWTILFGQDVRRAKKRSGKDKHTSSFPFKNDEAEKKKGR